MRKYILSFIAIVLISVSAVAEKVTFYTGVTPGCTLENPFRNYDPYIPLSYIHSGGSCKVTSIRKVDSVWCMTLTVEATDGKSAFPISFDYYLIKGESIYMRRLAEAIKTCELKVVSVDWNKAVFEIVKWTLFQFEVNENLRILF